MKQLFLCLITGLFFSFTYTSSPSDFGSFDLRALVCLIVLVSLIQGLVTLLISNQIIVNLLISAFAVANIISVHLIFTEDFVGLSTYSLTYPLVIGFIMFTMSHMIDNHPLAGKLLNSVSTAAILGVLVVPTIRPGGDTVDKGTAGGASAANIKLVDFETKPNVYFVSFDSLIPKSILKKHMDLDSVAYHEVLDEHFRPFHNFFADRVPTRQSLNSLLALDRRYYYQLLKVKDHHKLFQGLVPSPLFEIFAHNGYTTVTLFDSPYFGQEKGPYVDRYVKRNRGLCEFIDEKLKPYAFFGFCRLIENDVLAQMLADNSDRNQAEYLIEHLRLGLDEKRPHIVVAYIYRPGHTPGTFDMKDTDALKRFVQEYKAQSVKAASYIEMLVNFITSEDPHAILYVFGDHGPWLSRKTEMEDNEEFYIQDRFAVYGGIYPKDRCSDTLNHPYTEQYMTVLQGAHKIIACLASGVNAFRKQDDYLLPYRTTSGENQYEAFLYE